MRSLFLATAALAVSSAAFAQQADDTAYLPKPDAVVADGLPPIPIELADALSQYTDSRSAAFRGWDEANRAMIIATRFADTSQLHRVMAPGAARTQITFESEPVGSAVYTGDGRVLLTTKDIGGSEFNQIFRVENGKLVLLTDGKSRNSIGATSEDGSLIAFTSTRRTGRDNDIYLMDPRDPSTTRLVAERSGGGWGVGDISPDNKTMTLVNYIQVTKSDMYLLDIESGAITPLTDPNETAFYAGGGFDKQGRIWALSDVDSDFRRVGTIDRQTGKFTPVIDEEWDVSDLDMSEDESFMAYTINRAGQSVLKIRDMATGATREVDLPPGIIGGIEIAPWGEIGFTFSSNRSPADAYSVDPKTLKVTRWTYSEAAGLDPARNVDPELVEIESFDGERISGFLYRPDPAKFPGKRPLLVSIHGGPEGQSTAGSIGSMNYYVNELGIAQFFPNVRGSTGYGKRFVSLDNGPFKREDSVKDIGAFLDALQADPLIDADRMAVRGGSYGGYMCYASAIFYGDRFDAASCVVAISDFVTFLENTQDYRRDLRRVEYGDERDPVQRAKLKEISPLTRVDELRIPLMVSTGANDPRVPASEADQIIAAVRANGVEARHFLAMNEGHGFAKKENADYYTLAQLMFLQQYLLGK